MSIDVANTIFIVCVALGGLLVLLTLVLDDELNAVLRSLRLDVAISGVPLLALLFGFVAGFGAGGLLGIEVLNLGAGAAAIAAVVGGLIVVGVIYVGLRYVAPAFARRDDDSED